MKKKSRSYIGKIDKTGLNQEFVIAFNNFIHNYLKNDFEWKQKHDEIDTIFRKYEGYSVKRFREIFGEEMSYEDESRKYENIKH